MLATRQETLLRDLKRATDKLKGAYTDLGTVEYIAYRAPEHEDCGEIQGVAEGLLKDVRRVTDDVKELTERVQRAEVREAA